MVEEVHGLQSLVLRGHILTDPLGLRRLKTAAGCALRLVLGDAHKGGLQSWFGARLGAPRRF